MRRVIGGIWVKTKCLNRQEFVVVGWTDPEGSRPHLGSLLLGYHAADGALTYAGRAGTGMTEHELADLSEVAAPRHEAQPLAATPREPLRFAPVELRRVHWVRPKLVVEVTFLTWTEDGLLRQVVYQGLREDKPASEGYVSGRDHHTRSTMRRDHFLTNVWASSRRTASLRVGFGSD